MSRFRQAPPPAATLRLLQVGDLWAYHVSGTLRRPEQSAPCTLRGAIVVTVVPDTLVGGGNGLMLNFAQDLQVEAADGSLAPFLAPDLVFSFVQDRSTHDASILADNMGHNGASRRAAAPQIFYPGRWFLGTQYDNRLDFGDGDFVRNTLRVTGHVTVETSAGDFLSWVAEITSESPAMGKITGVDWWTPEIGAPAAFETNAKLPDGTTTRIQATLGRTNVLPASPSRAPRDSK